MSIDDLCGVGADADAAGDAAPPVGDARPGALGGAVGRGPVAVAGLVWLGSCAVTGGFTAAPSPGLDPRVAAVGYALWIGLVPAAALVVVARGGLVLRARGSAPSVTVPATVAGTLSLATVAALWAGCPGLVALALEAGAR